MNAKDNSPAASSKDIGTQLAEQRTSLALKRTSMAAERTLMAWTRTSLSMISFGFTMVKFFQYLDSTRGPTVGVFGRTWTPEAVGLSIMTIGILSLALAVWQYRKERDFLRAEGLEQTWSLAFVVSSLIALLGLLALGSLFLER